MKMTSKRAAVTLNRYWDLKARADEFMREKKHSSFYYRNLRFDEYGNIEEYVNTACHCHPEYEWKECATAQEFGEWLDKKAAESTD